jgi:hypothetical protein
MTFDTFAYLPVGSSSRSSCNSFSPRWMETEIARGVLGTKSVAGALLPRDVGVEALLAVDLFRQDKQFRRLNPCVETLSSSTSVSGAA